jgi:hypothetical protein
MNRCGNIEGSVFLQESQCLVDAILPKPQPIRSAHSVDRDCLIAFTNVRETARECKPRLCASATKLRSYFVCESEKAFLAVEQHGAARNQQRNKTFDVVCNDQTA